MISAMRSRSQFVRLVVLACVLFTASCQTTGGDFLGYFPLPKFPSGSIEKGTYQPKDKSFKVWAPYSDATDKSGKYNWLWTSITEGTYESEVLMRFTPPRFLRYTAGLLLWEVDPPTVEEMVRDGENFLGLVFPGIPTKIVYRGRSQFRPDMGFIVFKYNESENYQGAAIFYFGRSGRRVSVLRIAGRAVRDGIDSQLAHFNNESDPIQSKFVRSFRFTDPDL